MCIMKSLNKNKDNQQMKKYKIRFNYKFLPYVWLQVPKRVWKFFNSSDMFVDTASQKIMAKG